MATGPITLDERLRLETRPALQGVQRALKRFDLRDPPAMGDAFASLHALHAGIGDDAAAAALRANLSALRRTPPPPLRPPDPDDPLAGRYAALATRVTVRLVSRDWRADPGATAHVAAYLTLVRASDDWRALAAELDAMSARGARADRVARAASMWLTALEMAALGTRAAPR